jgi:thioredoxin-dependent peroxiredoxin
MRISRVGLIVAALAVTAAAVAPAYADTSSTTAPSPAATANGPGTGSVAPKVVLQSVLDGKPVSYDLQAAAAQRPVVFYFFPKAFTAG